MIFQKQFRLLKNLLLFLLYIIYIHTIRIKWCRGEKDESPTEEPFILALYHEGATIFSKTLVLIKRDKSFQNLFSKRNFCILISDHQDGDLMEWVAKYFKINTFRMNRKNPGLGIKEYIKKLEETRDLPVIAVDGPTGPYHKIHPGIFHIQKRFDYPIRFLSFKKIPPTHFRIQTWDRHLFPFPMSKIEVQLSKRYSPKTASTSIQLESTTKEFEKFIEDAFTK